MKKLFFILFALLGLSVAAAPVKKPTGAELKSYWENGNVCLSNGNNAKALYWFSKAAEHDHYPSIYALAESYYKGLFTPQDYAKAAELFKKCAGKDGDRGAALSLGQMYENGYGVRRDYKQAIYWYEHAVKSGTPIENTNLKKLRVVVYGSGSSSAAPETASSAAPKPAPSTAPKTTPKPAAQPASSTNFVFPTDRTFYYANSSNGRCVKIWFWDTGSQQSCCELNGTVLRYYYRDKSCDNNLGACFRGVGWWSTEKLYMSRDYKTVTINTETSAKIITTTYDIPLTKKEFNGKYSLLYGGGGNAGVSNSSNGTSSSTASKPDFVFPTDKTFYYANSSNGRFVQIWFWDTGGQQICGILYNSRVTNCYYRDKSGDNNLGAYFREARDTGPKLYVSHDYKTITLYSDTYDMPLTKNEFNAKWNALYGGGM